MNVLVWLFLHRRSLSAQRSIQYTVSPVLKGQWSNLKSWVSLQASLKELAAFGFPNGRTMAIFLVTIPFISNPNF